MRKIRGLLTILSVVSASLIIPYISKYVVANLITIRSGDSLKDYVMLSIAFYILQTSLTLLTIKHIYNYPIAHMGFNLENWKKSLTLTLRFVVIWLNLDFLFYFICLNYAPNFNHYIEYYYVKDSTNLLRDLIVGCLLAGVGEEPLFRGLVILVLSPIVTKNARIGKVQLPYLAFISGFLFMIAHIVYDITPFRIVRIDYLQLLLTFLLGTTWATMLIKTKSLLGPVLAHTLANTIQIISGYVIAFYVL